MLLSGLPEYIDDNEDLVRFLTHSSHYNTKMAKPAAFLPDPSSQETSVSRHGREPSDSLYRIGQTAAGTGRNLHAAALFPASAVRSAELDVFADEPPARHAAIRGWPWDSDTVLRKAAQKERAICIASKAEVLMFR